MKEVVINNCFGGFSLSYAGVMRYAELKGIKLYAWIDDIAKEVYGDRATLDNADEIGLLIHYSTIPIVDESEYKKLDNKKANDTYWSDRKLKRDDPILIRIVKEMGKKAAGKCADFKIVKIPNDVKWEIEEYDGSEWVSEKHRTWR